MSAFYTSFIFLARLHLDYGDIIYDFAFGESLHRDNALLVRTLGNQMSIRLSQTLIIVKSIKLVTVISGSLLVAESTLDPCNGYISLR